MENGSEPADSGIPSPKTDTQQIRCTYIGDCSRTSAVHPCQNRHFQNYRIGNAAHPFGSREDFSELVDSNQSNLKFERTTLRLLIAVSDVCIIVIHQPNPGSAGAKFRAVFESVIFPNDWGRGAGICIEPCLNV